MFKIFTFLTGLTSLSSVTTLLLLGRKFTVATSAIIAYLAATTLMVACLKRISSSLIDNLHVPPFLEHQLSWVLPSNFNAVTSAIITGFICRAAYDFATKKIEIVTSAN